jgi:hypothetical protein
MKKTFSTWTWSLGVVARSPVSLLGLALVVCLWGYGAYGWLWLPESSLAMLVLAVLWALAQVLVAAGVAAATVAAAGEAAMGTATRLPLRGFVGFSRQQFARSVIMVLAATILLLALFAFFTWVDQFALEVASFLTFRSQAAASPLKVSNAFWVVEALITIIVGGFLLSFLIILVRAGWREAWRQAGRTLARSCWRSPFWTSLLGVAVFGGLVYFLATWHPKVPPGYWDYTQLILRMGGALLLLAAGWLFLLLSLARLTLPSQQSPPS